MRRRRLNLGRLGPVGPDKSGSSPSSFPNGQPIDLAMDLAMDDGTSQ